MIEHEDLVIETILPSIEFFFLSVSRTMPPAFASTQLSAKRNKASSVVVHSPCTTGQMDCFVSGNCIDLGTGLAVKWPYPVRELLSGVLAA